MPNLKIRTTYESLESLRQHILESIQSYAETHEIHLADVRRDPFITWSRCLGRKRITCHQLLKLGGWDPLIQALLDSDPVTALQERPGWSPPWTSQHAERPDGETRCEPHRPPKEEQTRSIPAQSRAPIPPPAGRRADSYIRDISEQSPEDGEIPIEELIEMRVEASRRRAAKYSAHERVLELECRPFGIMIFGDPHLDNDGCDWELLMHHVGLIQSTDGIYGACVGDMQDNWIGRLQRLYADSSMHASDGWRLSRWLLEQIQWMALCSGNHDSWSNAAGANPLAWISKEASVLCYADDEVRMRLTWKGRPDVEPLEWMIRHDVPGRSWFHPTHGPNKEAMLDGRLHMIAAGHIHQWGQLTTEQRHNRVTTALRVRGYKRNDAHTKTLGFYEQTYGASVLVVVNPEREGSGRIIPWWDIELGCNYLNWLRS